MVQIVIPFPICYTVGGIDGKGRSKQRVLMFADFYNVNPVALTDEGGNEVDIIYHQATLSNCNN